MEWSTIINTVAAYLVGGGSMFFFFKETKSEKKADVLDKVFENIGKQDEFFNGIIDRYKETVDRLHAIIDKYEKDIGELQKQIDILKRSAKERDYRDATQDRKTRSMQNTIDCLYQERQHTNRLYCVLEKCELRKPELGTYKKDEDEKN